MVSREREVARHGAIGRDMFFPALLLRSLERRAEIAGCCMMQRFETLAEEKHLPSLGGRLAAALGHVVRGEQYA